MYSNQDATNVQYYTVDLLILVHSAAVKYAQGGSQHASTAAQLAGNLVNVRSIAAHFRPKIDAWSAAREIVTITPEQVTRLD